MLRHAAVALAILWIAGGTPGCSTANDMSSEHVSDAGIPAAGVPLALAEERAGRVSDVRYELHFTIPEAMDAQVTGRVTIRFKLADASRPLALDFAGPAASVGAVRAAGREFAATVRNEHVVVPAGVLRAGENEISMAFGASDLALNRGREFMYTLFVPARARLAFPCFDQPDIKARYALSLDLPRGWEPLANGAERTRSDTPAGTRVTFADTRPISTYLFAFAAGRFAIEAGERAGRQFRMLHRETDARKVARNRDAVFDLHASALAWLERYTGIPYPFDKFDFLLVPAFQFGGMEHPGSIFYNASALLLDPSATQNQKLSRASLIAHETAHMWFGDLVTMRWFNDVWMKEVFANFMAAKIVNPTFPEINHDLRFLYAHYPAAYGVDRTAGSNAIRQRLDNLNEAGGLYGAIIYQKAPIVMRQLEMIVGETGLRDGLREYLSRHSFANAAWPDLIAILDRSSPDDLEAWSRAWVDQAGRPAIASRLRPDGTAWSLTFTQDDPRPGRNLRWSQLLKVTIGERGSTRTIDVRLDAGAPSQPPLHLAAQPLYVLPTGGGVGYGDFILDDLSRAYLTRGLADISDALTRGAAVVTLWEEMAAGRVAPGVLFDVLTHALPREPDELNVGRMLAYTQHLYWKFLSPGGRAARIEALESLLRAGLNAAKTPSLKSAWFNAVRDTAGTASTLVWLRRVWEKKETVAGLTLAEPDYITLALELAVRDVAGAAQILADQTARIENADRKAQFEFVVPALSADAAVRDAFFDRLRDVDNRRRETWVLQGLAYLHHPLRVATSERHIPASLDLLREIQRTGDIFFPKRWADATLGGHQSASAAQKVSRFLEQLPKDYPERLRLNILSSADELFRASRSPGQ